MFTKAWQSLLYNGTSSLHSKRPEISKTPSERPINNLQTTGQFTRFVSVKIAPNSVDWWADAGRLWRLKYSVPDWYVIRSLHLIFGLVHRPFNFRSRHNRDCTMHFSTAVPNICSKQIVLTLICADWKFQKVRGDKLEIWWECQNLNYLWMIENWIVWEQISSCTCASGKNLSMPRVFNFKTYWPVSCWFSFSYEEGIHAIVTYFIGKIEPDYKTVN